MCCHCFLQDLSLGIIDCTPDPIYVAHRYRIGDAAQSLSDGLPSPWTDLAAAAIRQLPHPVVTYLSNLHISFRPIEGHAVVLAIFASLVAPFGECNSVVVMRPRLEHFAWILARD